MKISSKTEDRGTEDKGITTAIQNIIRKILGNHAIVQKNNKNLFGESHVSLKKKPKNWRSSDKDSMNGY